MAKLTLYIACSLDGYIATTQHNLDWLHAYESAGEDYGYHDFYARIGITLQGYDTFRYVEAMDIPYPFEGKTSYVFSRQPRQSRWPVHFVQDNPAQFIQKLKEESEQDIWLIGGGQIVARCLEQQLIDEYIISYIPLLLGKGIPLFLPIDIQNQLALIGHKAFSNDLLQVHYKNISS
ncbi:dihydrofolate reductase family protein [Cytophagales bacterium LB-30]|uniref:Dihydrofolate reductase family protein n=1 Tax=Shiella aurantiaca TaxID=3058365 RepID=A0ABT8F5A0_9BACT|nr:dihydrofolate reductase family protein [Shiella aurantiaca]MDN4165631.1 dihydrofolate reductase family protein [Shiella aurantiaca]